MSMSHYTVVSPDQNKDLYRRLIGKWWNWIVKDNPDGNATIQDNGKTVTFLRNDILGGPIQLTAGISSGYPANKLIKEITIEAGTGVFFPIYHVHICTEDTFLRGGGKCGTIQQCEKEAECDLDNVYKMWAKIKVNDSGTEYDITDDLKQYEIQSGEFQLVVATNNNLNREEGYHLGPGTYDGVSHGTYLYLDNFQLAKYVINFGGMATNYETQSIYTVTAALFADRPPSGR